MSLQQEVTQSALHLVGVEQLRKRWAWFVVVGILLMVLGGIAVGSTTMMTLATMFFLGWLMIVGGILQTLHGFTCKEHSAFFIDLLAGILYTVAGFLIVTHPAPTAIALTLLIAILLIFGGGFRMAVAIAAKFHHRLWLFLHGLINLLLGLIIWQNWPISGEWVIGLFIGIDMLFNGWSLIFLGLTARNLPASGQP